MAATSIARREAYYRVPHCLLKAYDRGHGPGLEPEDLQAWRSDRQEEAFRYGVDLDVSRDDLAAPVERLTFEIAADSHRAVHSTAGDFAYWDRPA